MCTVFLTGTCSSRSVRKTETSSRSLDDRSQPSDWPPRQNKEGVSGPESDVEADLRPGRRDGRVEYVQDEAATAVRGGGGGGDGGQEEEQAQRQSPHHRSVQGEFCKVVKFGKN